MKNESGISLVSVAVVIIVLLMLAGVSVVIIDQIWNYKIEAISTQVTESTLQEKIEMAWLDAKSSYLLKGESVSNMTEKSSFKEDFVKRLENNYQLKNVVISSGEDSSMDITFSYENQTFNFTVSADGKVKLNSFLKGQVKLGDYVEYPMEYVDVYSEKEYTSSNGWRVIDDGTMEGTSGYVKIMSTGIPVKWFYDSSQYKNNQEAADYLMNNFENITSLQAFPGRVEIETDDEGEFKNLILEQGAIEKNEMKGSDFKLESIADKVTTLSLKEMNQICNILYNTKRELNDTSKINDKYDLFHLKDSKAYYYWLATAKEDDENRLYYLSDEGIQAENVYRMGIRPVIYLKKDLEGKFENNIWKIIN